MTTFFSTFMRHYGQGLKIIKFVNDIQKIEGPFFKLIILFDDDKSKMTLISAYFTLSSYFFVCIKIVNHIKVFLPFITDILQTFSCNQFPCFLSTNASHIFCIIISIFKVEQINQISVKKPQNISFKEEKAVFICELL